MSLSIIRFQKNNPPRPSTHLRIPEDFVGTSSDEMSLEEIIDDSHPRDWRADAISVGVSSDMVDRS